MGYVLIDFTFSPHGYFFFFFWNVNVGFKATNAMRPNVGYIVLVYETEKMAREDRMECESTKFEPLGSQTEGRMTADILR